MKVIKVCGKFIPVEKSSLSKNIMDNAEEIRIDTI